MDPDQTAYISITRVIESTDEMIQCAILRAVSHIHRIQTETVTATELHRFVFGRHFTYAPNPWTKCRKMPV